MTLSHRLAVLLLFPAALWARPPLPPAPEAVTIGGIRYSVTVVKSETEFGADLLAERLEDSTLLSRTPLYRIRYEPKRPKEDWQIYPVALEIEGNRVFVTREDNERFSASLSVE